MSHPHLCTAVTIVCEVLDAEQFTARLADPFFGLFLLLLLRTEFRGSLQGQGRRDPLALPCPVVLPTGSTGRDLERARQPRFISGLVLESPDPDSLPCSSADSFVAGSVPWVR